MSNDFGTIAILKSSLVELDWQAYTSAMHHTLLVSVEGVSLEKIRFTESSQSLSNWHSAAESYGFGTPGIRNSQFLDANQISGKVEIIPEIFSPDNDGYNDVASIEYQFDEPGYTATVMIFNAAGQKVKLLVNNELMGVSGTWMWNGFDETNQKLPFGIYIVYIEVFDMSGKTQRIKKSVVLGGKL
jgi:hypothetical protein